ncbi:hypothetical protein QFC20_005545 [Naganishia adeliensis]|uniref:Uncharacterized protein n=1 Tax=Naganishia adeliensis TaxID=92952 RepID=A0ACC2VL84_9TREE|nr:hypothetical protein QFC20_005545 [Naganishia adeliensis]
MTNVFQAMFEPQQPMESQMNGQSHGFTTAHARMLGKRQRSASPIATMDDGMKGHQHKRTKPAWTALPTPERDAGFGQGPTGNHMATTGFFDLTSIMPTEASDLHQQRPQHQFPRHSYPFPFPSPNHLSPSGLVLPDSTMTHSTFTRDGGMTLGSNMVPSKPIEMPFPPTLPLEREGSHGSLHDLRARLASSRLQGHDLPSVEDANDGDDEMGAPDHSMRTVLRNGQNDVPMDVPVPRPPRNSFSSFAHGPDQMDIGNIGKPLATMISDRLAQDTNSQPNSRRSNISDSMGAAEQYFVDGMRGVEQQHKGWSSPSDFGDQGSQQCRQVGDVDMVCAQLSTIRRRMTS